MTDRERFLYYIKNFDEVSYEVVKAKNNDYSGADPDPLRNFKISADIAGCTVEQGILVRMADKMVRVSNLTARKDSVGSVGEKIGDTLMDLGKYAAILAYYCDDTYDDNAAVETVLNPEPIDDKQMKLELEPEAEDQLVGIEKNWYEKIFGKI